MNGNDLLKELYINLKLTGWLDAATKYFREHSEKFVDCTSGNGKIASVNLSVSFQPESLSAVADVKPSVFITMGHITTDAREFNTYSNGTVQSRTWIDNKLVVEINRHV